MSQRESIAQDFVNVLKRQNAFRLGTVTRDPGINIKDLAATAFPAVVVETGNEARTSITQGGSSAIRESAMEVKITVTLNSNLNADTQRNLLIESIEEILELDPERGGVALDTQLISVTTIDIERPYIAIELVFEVKYLYRKGNS